jgi:hypothetical protein
MICKKCLQDVDVSEGGVCPFYYGTLIDTKRRGSTTITRYRISGKEEVFLCNTCVVIYAMGQRSGVYRFVAIGVAMAAGLVLLLTLLAQNSTASVTFLLISGLILVVALVLFLLGIMEQKRVERQHYDHLSAKARAEYGSSLAVSMRRDLLQARGYTQFFTPERMKSLKLSINVP